LSDVSEEHVTSIFTVEEKASMKQAESCLKMEVIRSSKMSVGFQQTTEATDVRASNLQPTTVYENLNIFFIYTYPLSINQMKERNL
jgi:hypothetical protein